MEACMHRNLLFWRLKENPSGQKTFWRSQTKTQQASVSPGGFRAFVSRKLGFSVYTCKPAHINACILLPAVCVCLFFTFCVFDRESAAASERSGTQLQVPFAGAQRGGSGGRADTRGFYLKWTPGHLTVDSQLCVCDGKRGWRKLSHNYALLSVWPVILSKCERGRFCESFVVDGNRGFQPEGREKDLELNTYQSVCDLKDTLKTRSLHIRHWFFKSREKSVSVRWPWLHFHVHCRLCSVLDFNEWNENWASGKKNRVCTLNTSIWNSGSRKQSQTNKECVHLLCWEK